MSNIWSNVNQPYTNVTYSNTAGAVGPNQILTTSGSNGTSWASISATTSTPKLTVADRVMTVRGDPASLDVKGKVVINGLDLEERLKIIERVLQIPERDATMEAKYPSLKKKFDDYINTLEKYKTFERIKGTYD